MKKNGFTLIELLAVIVILAILAIITIPIIANIVDKARDGAIKTSMKNYLNAVEQKAILISASYDKKDMKNGRYTVAELYSDYELDIKGKGPDDGWVELKDNNVVNCDLYLDEYNIVCHGKNFELAKSDVFKNIPEDRMMDSYFVNNAIFKNMIHNSINDDEINNEFFYEEIDYTNQLEKVALYFLPIEFLNEGATENSIENYNIRIESIEFVTSKNVPNNAIASKDISNKQNGKVMVWYLDDDNDSKYEVYVGQDGGVIAPRNASLLFLGLNSINISNSNNDNYEEIINNNSIEYKLDNLNTHYTTNMIYMFYGTITNNLDLSNFDTTNVKNMSIMFAGSIINNLNLSSFNTSNVTDMSGMFGGSMINNLNLSSFNTSNVTDMSGMFSNNDNLTSLDLTNFDTSKAKYIDKMFDECPKLTSIKVGEFTINNLSEFFSIN